MRSSARAEIPARSSPPPIAVADRQAADVNDGEAASAGSSTGSSLNRAGRWLINLFGRSGPRTGRLSEADADPLLEFAPEIRNAHGSFERAARIAPTRTRFGPGTGVLVVGTIVVATGAGAIVANQLRLMRISSVAVKDGRVSIETRPSGAQVLIDGQSRGSTPLVLSMTPGAHTMVVRSEADERVVPLSVAAGAEITQYFEMKVSQPLVVVGRMSVVTDPAGAHVSVDGRAVGISPVSALELTAAQHKVAVTSATGSAERTVTIEPGASTSVVFSLPKVRAPLAGWLSLSSPFDVQIMEGTDVIAFGGTAKVMLTGGRHDLLLVNRSLEYQEPRRIDIEPGKVTPVRVDLPRAMLSANARPWADVFVDGNSVGQTPIGRLAVPIGTHEVLFRHPQLGERRESVVVRMKGPNRIAVDLTK